MMRPLERNPMLKRMLITTNLVLATTLTAMHTYEVIKYKLKKLAETETVNNEAQYVLVRLARGHYNKPGGIEQMKSDYQFFKIISKFHE
jgi:hypothetical protein